MASLNFRKEESLWVARFTMNAPTALRVETAEPGVVRVGYSSVEGEDHEPQWVDAQLGKAYDAQLVGGDDGLYPVYVTVTCDQEVTYSNTKSV